MRFLIKLTFLVIFLGFDVTASQLPRYLGSEKKFRSYVFNPNEVYRYLGHYTYQGFIEFDKDEEISTISMGDPSLWLFQHLGNRLFLKPVGQDHSQTNMTVITNKHIYHFELTAKEARNIDDKDLIFVAKFAYPDEKDKNILEFPRVIASDEPDMRDLSIYNFNYQYTGEGSIAPIKVFDNGNFTYFQFSHKNAEVPAIFSVDAAGFESMVNFRAAGDFIIVEKVAPQFTLRNGTDIVCVYNNGGIAGGRPTGYKAKAPALGSMKNFTAPRQRFFGAPKNEQKLTYPPSPQSQAPNFAPQGPGLGAVRPNRSGAVGSGGHGLRDFGQNRNRGQGRSFTPQGSSGGWRGPTGNVQADFNAAQAASRNLARGGVRKRSPSFTEGFGVGSPGGATGISGAAGSGGVGGPSSVDQLLFEPPVPGTMPRPPGT